MMISKTQNITYLCPKCGKKGKEYAQFHELRIHMEQDHQLHSLKSNSRTSSLPESQIIKWAVKLAKNQVPPPGGLEQKFLVMEDVEKKLQLQLMIADREKQVNQLLKYRDNQQLEEFSKRIESSVSSSFYNVLNSQDRMLSKIVENRNRELEKMKKDANVFQSEQSRLLSEIYRLYEDLQVTRDHCDQQTLLLAEKEDQVIKTTRELHQLYSFLLNCTQREAKGRAELEEFFQQLISRTVAAEAEVRILRQSVYQKQPPLRQQKTDNLRETRTRS